VSVKLPPPIPDWELVPWWDWREGKRPPGVRTVEDVDQRAEPPPLPLPVSVDEFVEEDEPGAQPLVGDEDGAVIPQGGDVMFYGDGGTGKTTLSIDLGFRLASGDDWLGLPVSQAVSVLLIENEGPRPLFRAKLRRKLKGWRGSPIGERLQVLEEPWGEFSFADEAWIDALAAVITFLAIDVLIVGPVTRAGMNEAGTLQQVRDFMGLVQKLREQTGRHLTVILVHHENKGGQVSGAWEGAGDTLFHVQGQGHGRTRLYIQKARWSSSHHATALNLLWTEGEGFAVEDKPELDDAAIAEAILAYVREHAGTGWGKVEEAVRGVGNTTLREVRDGLLSAWKLVNVVKGEALDHIPERTAASLQRDDWLDSRAAADYLGISVGHLHNLKGRVPSHKVGGRRRYRRSELDDYQRQGT
jgi:KaiC/GvpD/RAD55 family RecA-like ATPase